TGVSLESSRVSYGYIATYELVDANGRKTTEEEDDLKAYTAPTTDDKPKVIVNFDSVIIADEKRQQILEALEQINQADLIFDEWDSLIYTRANVGPILGAQINELLSQIERFNGLTIFTTNRLGTLDEAVNRRLALKLEFDMPTLEQRAEIWKRMFPKRCPLD